MLLIAVCWFAYKKREEYLFEIEELLDEIEKQDHDVEHFKKSTLKLQLKYEVNAKAEVLLVETENKIHELKRKFKIDKASLIHQLASEKNQLEENIDFLKEDYQKKLRVYGELLNTVETYEEEVGLLISGFYKPHFNFSASEEYKARILHVRDQQKLSIRNKDAVICPIDWEIDGSKVIGRKMQNTHIRLTLRSFNNECDAIIANTTWRNAERMEKRLLKAAEDINKLNEDKKVFISSGYVNLKLQEFYLVHEHASKAKEEQVERAELRQQAREEAKLEQELQSAQKEEDKYQRLLEKAMSEAERATGTQFEFLQGKINQLSEDLKEAQEKSERALSMAQQTKAGYVYIISNIGSFGKGIYKIGMTRRIDPMDRVKELSDASVPFIFDVHALIYCEDAPSLENELHKEFADKRLNLRNNRKEFFRVSLGEIEEVVKRSFPEAEFIPEPEAQDYYESIAVKNEIEHAQVVQEKKESLIDRFPSDLN